MQPPRRLAGDLDPEAVVAAARAVGLLVLVVHRSIVSPGIAPSPPESSRDCIRRPAPRQYSLDHPTRSRAMHEPPTLFFDVGGVLLTNGWDTPARKKAAETFGLEYQDFQTRHEMLKTAFETGRIDLDTYVKRAIFYQPRSFTADDFKTFMFGASALLGDTLDFVRALGSDGEIQALHAQQRVARAASVPREDLRPRVHFPWPARVVLPRPGQARRGHLHQCPGHRVVLRGAGAVHRRSGDER